MSTLPTVARRHPLLAFAPDAPDWEGAACVGHDHLFFVDDYTGTEAIADTAEAKRICEKCDIRARCLEWAMKQTIPYGVWGGLTAEERAQQRKRAKSRRRI